MNTTTAEFAAVAAAPEVKLTASQQRAVAQFRAFMRRQLDPNPERGDIVDKFELTATDYGAVWVCATTDMVKLGEGNLLRALDRQHWFVQIGKGGAINVYSCPKSMRQFKGRRAFNMNFTKSVG